MAEFVEHDPSVIHRADITERSTGHLPIERPHRFEHDTAGLDDRRRDIRLLEQRKHLLRNVVVVHVLAFEIVRDGVGL